MTKLAALLENEASAEIEAILSEARTSASEIVAQAEEEAKAQLAQRERLSLAQAEASRVRARSAAQLEASSLRLRAQHGSVEEVFGRAEAELRTLSQDQTRYPPILKALLDEAVEALGGPEKVDKVSAHPSDVARVKEAAKAHGLGDKVEADAGVQGGVKLKAVSNVTVENSLFDRLEAAKDELASEVSRLLAAADGAGARTYAASQTDET